MSTFIKPCSLQASSRLMQLPAELRLKILRNLLRQSHPLHTISRTLPLKGRIDRSKFDDNVSISAQILRCCQQFYSEGYQVLYNENVLEILICEDYYYAEERLSLYGLSFICEILGGRVAILDEFEELREYPFDLLSRAQSYLGHEDVAVREEEGAKYMLNYLPAMARFQRLNIHIDPETRKEMFCAGRILKDFVRGKDVTLSPNLGPPKPEARYASMLESCKIWSCNSFAAVGCPPKDYKDVLDSITSGRAIQDTYPLWENLVLKIIPRLPTSNYTPFQQRHQSDLHAFGKSVFKYHYDKAEQQYVSLLAKAIAWNKRHGPDRTLLGERQIQHAEENLRIARERLKREQDHKAELGALLDAANANEQSR